MMIDDDKNINITLSDKTITIRKDKREIKAEEIYNMLDYKIGDKYKLEKLNNNNIDPNVFDLFYDLLQDIVNKLNKHSDEHNNAI